MGKEKNAASPVDVLSVLDGSEENYAGKCVAEEEEEHAHDDEEALVHADHHGQQQHLQSHLNSSHTHTSLLLGYTFGLFGQKILQHKHTHMLPTYREESEDNHTCAHHVGICILEGEG